MNLASLLLQERSGDAGRLALALPRASGDMEQDMPRITYGDLRRRVARLQRGIERLGLRPGDRVVMLSPLGVDFFALALALLASGQVLVFLDGRLDRRRVLQVLRAARPRAVVSVRALLRLWPLVPALWGARRIVTDVDAPDRGPLGTAALHALLLEPESIGEDAPRVALQPADHSALLSFTSGTTGRPKGADRTHGILLAQHLALKAHAPDREGDVDMPCFPAVVLHNLACGISTVLPPIDLRHPGAADPGRVVAAMRRFGVTSLSGAPAFLALLAERVLALPAVERPSLRRLIIGGAPVSRRLAARLVASFPGAAADAVYGSTEAEPMTHVGLAELAASEGEGYLVGRPAPVADLALVDLPEPAPPLGPAGLDPHRVPAGQSGEVLVRGPHVNQRYVGDEEAARRHKVRDPDGSLWHRTGDLARRDAEGRYWLTGRVPDRVTHRGRALLPYVIEAALADEVPALRRAALVAHDGAPEGELALTCADEDAPAAVAAARAALGRLGAPDLPVSRLQEIPVDARHNSKIDRPLLRAQLARRGRGTAP